MNKTDISGHKAMMPSRQNAHGKQKLFQGLVVDSVVPSCVPTLKRILSFPWMGIGDGCTRASN